MTTPHERFSVSTPASGSAHLVRLAGRLGSPDVGEFEALLAGLAHDGRCVIVDLSSAALIDAALARSIRQVAATAARTDRSFAACAARGQPLEVLEVLGIAKRVGAYLTVAEAIAEAGSGHLRTSLDDMVHDLLTSVSNHDAEDPDRRRAVERAIEMALPLARTLARRYQSRGEPLDDLVQVASLGIVRAVQNYDVERGRGFVAYAVPTVLGELRRHFRDHTWAVRPPRRLQELRSAIGTSAAELTQALGREPTADDFADHLAASAPEVEEAMLSGSGMTPASLDAPIGAEGEQSLYGVVGVDDAGIDRVDYHTSLGPLIEAEPPTVREILTLRFLHDLTQSEIAERVGTSQMTVSRILRDVLARFRVALLAG